MLINIHKQKCLIPQSFSIFPGGMEFIHDKDYAGIAIQN